MKMMKKRKRMKRRKQMKWMTRVNAFVVNAPGQRMIKMFGKYETLLLTVLMIFFMSIFLLILSILFQIRA